MKKGGFDLRGWENTEYNSEVKENSQTSVLGLLWNRQLDTLKVNMNWLEKINLEKISKRVILSVAHRVYDPIGYTSPVMLCPKLLLQKTCKMGLNWDEEVPEDLRQEFLLWFNELQVLEDIHIPRWIHILPENLANCTIHTFFDASKDAFAAVVFLRIQKENYAELFLLAAKSRVSPLKVVTIPRMELLAALVGARLTNTVVEALGWIDVERFYWSDSTTVIAWISREENWSVFVRNRVLEIRELSNQNSWRHVSGEINPADLPSRGCKAKRLLSLRWWEGPEWLKESVENWNPDSLFVDEEEVSREKLKSKVLINVEDPTMKGWYLHYFSKYQQIVRLIAWILRFKHNCLSLRENRVKGELTTTEYNKAERILIKMIQLDSFSEKEIKNLRNLAIYKDENGLIRVKTQITLRKDEEDFRKPILLPAEHEVVKRLVMFEHNKNSHCGLQILMNILREKYWILRGKKVVRKIIAKCTICQRFSSKKLESAASPLPANRVCDAAVFQITGIDAAGPLYLKGNHKVWILLFTCAVYRAVHLELITSISTEAFLMALRRFVARRGRCSTIYCDNGTNFVGAANLLKLLDWKKILKYSSINAIEWKFNPPTASWWGGWWERLIRIMKDILRRVLGRSYLSQEELVTVLCDCESLINSRPLCYMADCDSVMPISPAMFIQDISEWNVPDIDAIDQKSLNRRIKYRQDLQKDLRKRFRSEYLGALVQKVDGKDCRTVTVGDVVLVGADNSKRINWPLGRIVELLPGRDGKVRLVRVQTSQSKLLRPIQRIYPLEIASSDSLPTPLPIKTCKSPEKTTIAENKTKGSIAIKYGATRSGRKIKIILTL